MQEMDKGGVFYEKGLTQFNRNIRALFIVNALCDSS